MDPCPFVRIVVGSLSLKSPVTQKSSFTGGSNPSCYCKIKLKNFSTQYATIPVSFDETTQVDDQIHACFNFKKHEFEKFLEKSGNILRIDVYSARGGSRVCSFGSGKLLGSVVVSLELKSVIRNEWVGIGDRGGSELFLNVRAEPDPRFVFEFDGEPECSPQVFQVNGNVRQAVFTCEFGCRNSGERNLRSRSSLSEASTSRSWFSSLRSDKKQPLKERKGWSITIHDLSGSPVAMASMVTPFVPSQGTDRVSRSNPGAWLILRPGHGTWKPWGRLEAWRENNDLGDHLGYRFELLPDAVVGSADTITLSNSSIGTKSGGKFTIDISNGASPMTTPSSSFDSGSGSGSELGSGTWAHLLYRGFVMSSTVAGEGRCSKPEVEVGVQHVSCTEDAAAFVALAAAMDLSMDACQLFSRKLRKELRQDVIV